MESSTMICGKNPNDRHYSISPYYKIPSSAKTDNSLTHHQHYH